MTTAIADCQERLYRACLYPEASSVAAAVAAATSMDRLAVWGQMTWSNHAAPLAILAAHWQPDPADLVDWVDGSSFDKTRAAEAWPTLVQVPSVRPWLATLVSALMSSDHPDLGIQIQARWRAMELTEQSPPVLSRPRIRP